MKRIHPALFFLSACGICGTAALFQTLAIAGFDAAPLLIVAPAGALLAVGAAVAQLRQGKIQKEQMPFLFSLAAMALWASQLLTVVAIPFLKLGDFFTSWSAMLQGLVLFLFAGFGMFAFGAAIGLALCIKPGKVGKIFGLVFTGGAAGLVLFALGAWIFGPEATMVVSGIVAAGTQIFLCAKTEMKKQLVAGILSVAVMALLLSIHAGLPFLNLRFAKGATLEKGLLHGRSAVIQVAFPAGKPEAPVINGHVLQSPSPPLVALFQSIIDRPSILAFGVGKTIAAKFADPDKVTLLFENEHLIRLANQDKETIAFESIVANPMAFLRHQENAYDLIFWGSEEKVGDVFGVWWVPGNPIGTIEGALLAQSRLSPQGIAVWMLQKDQPRQIATAVMAARKALVRSGVEHSENHLLIAADEHVAALGIKNAPFEIREVSMLLDACAEAGLSVLYSPFSQGQKGSINKGARAVDLDGFLKQHPEFSPATLSRPLSKVEKTPIGRVGSVSTLTASLGVAILIILVALALPIVLIRPFRIAFDEHLRIGGFFLMLAMATSCLVLMMLHLARIDVEHLERIPFLYAPGLLALIGIGAFASKGLKLEFPPIAMKIVLMLAVGFSLFLYVLSPILIGSGFDGAGGVIFGLLAVGLGISLGAPVPYALRKVDYKGRSTVPWMAGVYLGGIFIGSAFAAWLVCIIGFTGMLVIALLMLIAAALTYWAQ